MLSDVASYKLTRTNTPIGRLDDQEPKISQRFGMKAKVHEQSDEYLVIIKPTAQDLQK